MTTAVLLQELRSRGVRLAVNGDRLRITAPAGTVTAEIREAISRNKPALIALMAKPAERVDPPLPTSRFRYKDGDMDFGDICAGWSPQSWSSELRRMADRCDEYRPDIATYYRDWAADIERRLDGPNGGV